MFENLGEPGGISYEDTTWNQFEANFGCNLLSFGVPNQVLAIRLASFCVFTLRQDLRSSRSKEGLARSHGFDLAYSCWNQWAISGNIFGAHTRQIDYSIEVLQEIEITKSSGNQATGLIQATDPMHRMWPP